MATFFDITLLPIISLTGLPHRFRVTAKNASGAVDTVFTGTVVFTSTDASAVLPASYTFLLADAGIKDFYIEFNSAGAWTLTATSGVIVGNGRTTTQNRPPGWGYDPEGILPYGDSTAGVGASLLKALAYSTREVDVTVTNFVQDNSSMLPGDALNPLTWSVQRLDTLEFLNIVSVTQVGTFTYRLLCFQEFGDVSVTHRINASSLRDDSGTPINAPRNVDFLGLLANTQSSTEAELASQNFSVSDYANAQTPNNATFGGTLEITANGDYATVTGTELTKKLVTRRLISRPGDFFHLPNYGLGLRNKETLVVSDLPKLKKAVEQQCLLEKEVESAKATLTLIPATNTLQVQVRVKERMSGQQVEIGFEVSDSGVVL